MSEQFGFNSCEVSKRFIAIRTENNLTQEELAEKLSVSLQTVKNYEKAGSQNVRDSANGDRTNAIAGMKIETLFKMAQKLSVSADYLLGLTNDPSLKKTAVDELGLSPVSISWIKHLKENTTEDEFQYVSWAFESTDFQMMFTNLLNYFFSLKIEMFTSCLFTACAENTDNSEDMLSLYLSEIKRLAGEEQNNRDKIFYNAEYERISLSATNGLWNILSDPEIGFTLSSMYSYRVNKHMANLLESFRGIAETIRDDFLEEHPAKEAFNGND